MYHSDEHRAVSGCADITPIRTLRFDRFSHRSARPNITVFILGSRRPRVRISLSRPHLPHLMLSPRKRMIRAMRWRPT